MRGRPPCLTELQRLVAQEIVLSGDASCSEVATVYGCTKQTINNLVRGLPRPPSHPKRDPALIAEIRQLWIEGKTYTEITRATGASSGIIGRNTRDLPQRWSNRRRPSLDKDLAIKLWAQGKDLLYIKQVAGGTALSIARLCADIPRKRRDVHRISP